MKIKAINLKKQNSLKSRRAQGVFGLSFGMIWSIILIIFFVVSAFIGINAFLRYQRNATIGMFIDGLQLKINEAWNSQGLKNFRYNATLPGGVQYVCFINSSADKMNASNVEENIYDEVLGGAVDFSKNFYIYAPDRDYSIKWANIKHIDLSHKNPICVQVRSGGRVSIKIERNFEDPLVSVGA